MNTFSSASPRRPRVARSFRQPRTVLALERLEERQLLTCSSISGFVYHDANNNGLFDSGETPLANSQIQLLNSSNVVVGTTTTDASGYYLFNADATIDTSPKTTQASSYTFVSAKTNQIQVGSLPKFDSSLGALTQIDISISGQISSDILVENRDPSAQTITGTVAGKLAIAGPDFNTQVATTSSSKTFNALSYDGVLDFAGASGKDFGWVSVPGSSSFVLTDSQSLADYSGAGNVTVYENSTATSNATGGGNFTASINSKGGGTITVVYHYIPENCLAAGAYTIVQTTQPQGYLPGKVSSAGVVLPASFTTRTISVNLPDNGNLTHNDFGHVQPAKIGGFVYYDANNNAIKGPSELGIGGATVTLTGTDDTGAAVNLSQTTVPAGTWQGLYYFQNLRPGTYKLTETQPSGYLDGKDTIGSQGGVTGNDVLSNLVLGSGANGINNNFGELLPAMVGGFVYYDINNNGVKETGEPGIGGVTVKLTGTDLNGAPVNLSQTTVASGTWQGLYYFQNLLPGTYILTETQPSGYLDGKDTIGSQGGTTANDAFSNVILAGATNGINNNFGELLPADMAIVKNANPTTVAVGAPVAYTLTVSNLGPANADNVVVQDQIPAGETFDSASGAGWSISQANGVLTATIAGMAAGASSVITVNVHAPQTVGTFPNTATVTSSTPDVNLTNNSSQAAITTVQEEIKATSGSLDLFVSSPRDLGFLSKAQFLTGTQTITTAPVSYVVSADNGLYRHDASGWTKIGAGIRSASAVTESSGTVAVYLVTLDQALFRYDNVSGWTQIGGSGTIQGISAGTDTAGRGDVFVITTGGALYQFGTGGWRKFYDPGTVRSVVASDLGRATMVTTDGSVFGYHPVYGWFRLTSAGFATSVSAVSEATGGLVVFAVTTTGGLWRHDDTAGWTSLNPSSGVASATAGTDAQGHAEVYAVTKDGSLYEDSLQTGWMLLGSAGSIAAATAADNDTVLAVTTDGTLMQHNGQSGWLKLSNAGFVHL